MPARLSVVILALNEEALLPGALAAVRAEADELIVVDGGSSDGTSEVAAQAGATVIRASRGRGRQLHAGARQANGDWLVFLHADTRLEPGWGAVLQSLDPDVLGGAFRFAVDSPRWAYRPIEAGVALRCQLLRLPYGDQGIFVRREVYGIIGGFAPFPLMEDVEFMRRLGQRGRLAFPRVRAYTSARRWERSGLVCATLRNWCLLLLYAAGWSPERLARVYDGRDHWYSLTRRN
jgi:rSAM/selenodomain-associated transferase 2